MRMYYSFRIDRYILNQLLVTSMLIALVSPSVTAANQGAISEQQPNIAYQSAHIECENTLRDILKTQEAVSNSIHSGAMIKANKQLEEIASHIVLSRNKMNQALLNGAWKSRTTKHNVQLLSDRLESLRILNFIAVAFTSKYYEYPKGHIPNSVKHSVKRFFIQLHTLVKNIHQTNEDIKSHS